MLWIKNHQPLSLLLFSVAAFCLFFLLGPSSSCSAASQSFTYDSSNIPSGNQLVWQGSSGTLTDTPLISFTPVYVEVFVSGYSYYYSYNGSNGYGALTNGQWGGSNLKLLVPFNSSIKYSLDISSLTSDSTMELWIRFGQFRSNIINTSGSSITYVFYDFLPSSDCPDCPDCPEIPETPYGDKLDKIYNAIMIGSATLLVIYFFFAIYSMFFGGLKK